jgi:2-dehydro-3-deoxygluconokinase
VAATLTADDLDWDYVGRADWLHMTGITPALSEICQESIKQITVRAKARGCKISFDVNYRSLLWSQSEARSTLHEILPHMKVLIATEADAKMLLGQTLEPEELLSNLFRRYAPDVAVITCGASGSVAQDADRVYRSHGYEVCTVNRSGAGDAFDAGLLYGYLTSDLETGLDYGSAMAALKMTIPQNTPLIERADVERLLTGKGLTVVR